MGHVRTAAFFVLIGFSLVGAGCLTDLGQGGVSELEGNCPECTGTCGDHETGWKTCDPDCDDYYNAEKCACVLILDEGGSCEQEDCGDHESGWKTCDPDCADDYDADTCQCLIEHDTLDPEDFSPQCRDMFDLDDCTYNGDTYDPEQWICEGGVSRVCRGGEMQPYTDQASDCDACSGAWSCACSPAGKDGCGGGVEEPPPPPAGACCGQIDKSTWNDDNPDNDDQFCFHCRDCGTDDGKWYQGWLDTKNTCF